MRPAGRQDHEGVVVRRVRPARRKPREPPLAVVEVGSILIPTCAGRPATRNSDRTRGGMDALHEQPVARMTDRGQSTALSNALVEGKNANVVRKWFGHDHIP